VIALLSTDAPLHSGILWTKLNIRYQKLDLRSIFSTEIVLRSEGVENLKVTWSLRKQEVGGVSYSRSRQASLLLKSKGLAR
jgi:hypothetical protein